MEKEYLKAEDARKIAEDALEKVMQLDQIIDIVTSEAKDGKRRFTYKAHIAEITRNRLNELGYTVGEEKGSGTSISTEISW